MHLSGQADAAHGSVRGGLRRAQVGKRSQRGGPPVARILLRPQGVRTRDRQRGLSGADDAVRIVEQQR
jgi:hypothetical protein